MKTPVYRPIPCDIHSELELAILRRQTLQVVLRRHRLEQLLTLQPLDLQTRRRQEFLVWRASPDAPKRWMRLDRLRRLRLADGWQRIPTAEPENTSHPT